ncbi:hypothetical protein VPH35_033547 [Triticum aestivum]
MGDAARHCVCGCSVDLFHSMASQQVWDYNVLSLRKEIHVQKKMVKVNNKLPFFCRFLKSPYENIYLSDSTTLSSDSESRLVCGLMARCDCLCMGYRLEL